MTNANVRYNSETDFFEIYFENEWHNWKSAGFQKLWLYNYGNEYVDEIGGWTLGTFKSGGAVIDTTTGSATRTATKNGDNIYVAANIPTTAASLASATAFTTKAIDITNYSRLIIHSKNNTTKWQYIKLFNKNPQGAGLYDNYKSFNLTTTGDLYQTFDITEYNGLTWIAIQSLGYSGDSGGSSGSPAITMYEMWLEK